MRYHPTGIDRYVAVEFYVLPDSQHAIVRDHVHMMLFRELGMEATRGLTNVWARSGEWFTLVVKESKKQKICSAIRKLNLALRTVRVGSLSWRLRQTNRRP